MEEPLQPARGPKAQDMALEEPIILPGPAGPASIKAGLGLGAAVAEQVSTAATGRLLASSVEALVASVPST